MECGVYSELRKRKHSLRAISPLNHQHIYLPCLQLNRVGTHSHTHTRTLSPPTLKIFIFLKYVPLSTGSRGMPLGADEGTLHGPAEKAPALPMPGSGLWEKTVALTFK